MHRDDLDLEVPAPDRSEARDAGLSVTGRTFQAALQALGYKPTDAEKMISRAQQQGESADSASQLIKQALQTTVKL